MRVLIAPDEFAGSLNAVEAAEAIADGWARRAPGDLLVQAPMSDGGTGLCAVLHAALGGTLLAVTVTGPYGDPVPATVLLTGGTAYVEAAQACGLHLTPPEERDPERATTRGIGELIAAALDAGAERVVVGLGGIAANDAGAGLLAALGATADAPLTDGPAALGKVTRVDLAEARARIGQTSLVAAVDVDNPLLGLRGATNVHGDGRGVAEDRKQAVDATLEAFADATDRRTADLKGAGAGGGTGFALLLLGAATEPGVRLVADTVGLPRQAAEADLVVTGEGAFDFSSRSGTVPYAVAEIAATALRPCIALAGEVMVGAREMRAMGVESAYSVADLVGEPDALAQPRESLARLAERVARTWSHAG